jgi:alpha-glucosidase
LWNLILRAVFIMFRGLSRGVFAILIFGCACYGFASDPFEPLANPQAVTTFGNARFTVLTPAIIRMEWSSDAVFENRASLTFIDRNTTTPAFTTSRRDNELTINTGELLLRYEGNEKFSPDNLSIHGLKADFDWKPGQPDHGNLRGTVRTLDSISGATALDPGLLSRDGWALVDDSKNLLFDNSDWPWAAVRNPDEICDWYFFGYGHDYKRELADYTKIAGKNPMPPRFAFGGWWSRYWSYHDSEFRQLVREFQQHGVPLDVLVIDMGWHLPGWTGYTWNPEYFPDPQGFLNWVHDQDLRVTLNLHPASGVRKHEAAFKDVARAVGADPETTDRIAFDPTNRTFVEAYFKYLHHPLEKMGVDFWWIDWQQGTNTNIAGLDPLPWLNYLHWTDMERNPDRDGKRPLIMSRWGGLGGHRYPLGFSGDTFCNWESLAFQPYFTSTAGNVAFSYWSHDIGGHQPGVVQPELYARWIEWGAFNPILRTHTTSNPNAERRIWAFPPDVYQAAKRAWLLRYTLIPYIYTTARECYDSALPLCRPLYLEWPEENQAYNCPGEYLFGDSMLVAPVTQPESEVTSTALTHIWLPPGTWHNRFTGKAETGPKFIEQIATLDEIPVYIRDGAVIPASGEARLGHGKVLDPIIFEVWPGSEGSGRLYEDDGETTGYQHGKFAWTVVRHWTSGRQKMIEINAPQGSYDGMPEQHSVEVQVRDSWQPKEITLNGKTIPQDAKSSTSWTYDPQTLSTVIRLVQNKKSDVRLVLKPWNRPRENGILRDGIRGTMNDIDRAIDVLGASAPDELKNAAAARDNTTVYPDEPEAAVKQYVLQYWPKIISAVIQCPATVDERRQALSFLLGLGCDVKLSAAGKGAISVQAVLKAQRPLPGLTGSVSMDVPTGWYTEDSKLGATNALQADAEARLEVLLKPDSGLPGTAEITTHFRLKAGDAEISFPVSQVAYPSINAWQIIGPFDNPGTVSLAEKFPPEDGIDLKATYTGKQGRKIGWKLLQRGSTPGENVHDDFYVNLHEFYGGRRNYQAVSYAASWIDSPRDTTATLALGSDDGVAVWLNGSEVWRIEKGRTYTPKEDKVAVRLHKGVNELLLKVSQDRFAWGFGASLLNEQGEPMTGLTVQTHP